FFGCCGGVGMVVDGLGLSREELRLICQVHGEANLKAVAGWWREVLDLMNSLGERRRAPLPADHGREPPVLAFDPAPQLLEPEPAELPRARGDKVPGGRDPAFDRLAKKTNHEIAKR